jgi:hypothetical protein
MSYIKIAQKVYDSLDSVKFKELLKGSTLDFDKVKEKLQRVFELDELRSNYISEISKTIDQFIPFFKDDFRRFLRIKEVSYYYHNISSSTLSHLFWIWEKGIKLSEEKLNQFVQSFFLGVFGYKMIDYQKDNKNSYPELSFVGFYAIKIAENLLEKIFSKGITNPVYLKYAEMYTQIEYLEKKNRWKASFFLWNEPLKLGLKAAPTFIVHESLFRYAGYTENKIKDLIRGLMFLSAAMQLIDDLADAKEDLINGYETLVVKGYFETFGNSSEVTEEKINQILSQERLKLIYRTGQKLFNEARILISKYDEYLLQLILEIQNLNFTTLFEIKK